MCGRSEYLKKPAHLAPETFRVILKKIRPYKMTFSGLGEPFMHPNLLAMVKQAKQTGCSINTTTNGTLLTPAQCEAIVHSGLDLIKISIDGATPETYQRIRGEDKFLTVIDGLKMLANAKKRLNSVTPYIRLNYVVSQYNAGEMAATVQLAGTLGVDAVYFQPLEMVGIEQRKDRLVGDLRYDEFSQYIEHALNTARQFQVNTNLDGLQKNLPVYWDKYQPQGGQSNNRICILPWFSAYVTVDGFVRPCCSFSQTNVNLGNILTTDMLDIWNGKSYQHFRKAIRIGKRPYPICVNCVPQRFLDIVRASGVLPGFLT